MLKNSLLIYFYVLRCMRWGMGFIKILKNPDITKSIIFGWKTGKPKVFGLKPIFLRRSYITWQEKFSLWKLCCAMPTSP